MVPDVVANVQFEKMAVLCQLAEDRDGEPAAVPGRRINIPVKILVDGIKIALEVPVGEFVVGIVGWVMVDVGEEDGLRKGRLNVLARATIAVAA